MASTRKTDFRYNVLGTLVVVVAMILSYLLLSALSSAFSAARAGGVAYVANMRAYPLALIALFILYEGIFMFAMPGGILSPKGSDETERAKMRRIRTVAISVCAGLAVAVILIGSNWFTIWTGDGIRDCKIFTTESFTYEEARQERVFCDDRGLGYEVTSPSGRTYSLFDGTSAVNDGFDREYGSAYAFAVHVHGTMQTAGVRQVVQNRERLESVYRQAYPETWAYIEKLLPAVQSVS